MFWWRKRRERTRWAYQSKANKSNSEFLWEALAWPVSFWMMISDLRVMRDSPVVHRLEKAILMPLSLHNGDQVNSYIYCIQYNWPLQKKQASQYFFAKMLAVTWSCGRLSFPFCSTHHLLRTERWEVIAGSPCLTCIQTHQLTSPAICCHNWAWKMKHFLI